MRAGHIPDNPEYDKLDEGGGWCECEYCSGSGHVRKAGAKDWEECRHCRGTGSMPDEDLSEVEQMGLWAEKNRD